MSENISRLINQVPDPTTRSALRKVFYQLKADLDTNKNAFDNHVHNYDSSTSSTDQLTSKPDADDSGASGSVTVDTSATFENNLK